MRIVLLATAGLLYVLLFGRPTLAQDGNPCFEERQQLRESVMRGQVADPRPVIACYTRVLNSGTAAPADAEMLYANRASLHAMTGDYQAALNDLDRAIGLNRGTSVLQFWLQERCYFKTMLNRLSEALLDCDRSLAMQPEDARALLYRGLVYLRSGDNAKALDDYEKIAQRGVPTNPANFPLYYEALYGRGIARKRLGDFAGGEADMAATEKWHSIMRSKFSQYGISGH